MTPRDDSSPAPAPAVSRRIAGLMPGGSDGWEVLYRAREMKAAGRPVLNLAVGDHDLRTPDLLLDAMDRSARGGNTGYAPVPGSAALRAAIAARVEARTGVPTAPGNVLVTTGGQAALFAAVMAATDPGDGVITLDPYYASYPPTVLAASARNIVIETRPGDGFRPVRAALDAAGPARALLINTPNNPTGAVYDRATLQMVVEFCRDRGLWLISDEVYAGQVWDGEHLSPRALPGMAERCLVIGSLSKSHRMTGARLGWLVGPAGLIAQAIGLSNATTYGVPGFIQDAAIVALTDGDGIEAEVAALYRARRAAVLEALQGENRVRPVGGAGGMYVMLDARAAGLPGPVLAMRLLEERGIAAMPGESFGRAAAGHLRVALTLPEDQLVTAVRGIADFIGGLS